MKTLRLLTILLAVSLATVSIFGGFVPGTYARDAASMAAQGTGQDLVDLFLVVPLLLLSFLLFSKGSRVATLIYGGTLLYILYSFVIYCFGVHFNRLFLVYCATLGLSLYAFILFMTQIRKQRLEGWFAGAPVKWVAGYLFFVAVVFYILWLSSLVPAIIQDTVPRDVAGYGLLVNPVHVIDMAFALPGLILGSVLLWKGKATGYLIASIALVFMILLTIALAGMVIMLFVRDISEDYTVAMVFAALTLTSIVFSVLFFRKIKPAV
ncbi:MAG TPA: hypothetical protein ENO20_14970 [Bacteroides sp.]|nr:hypothetical protein [Bacteroides sp.]